MPIEGKSLGDAAQRFADHLNELLSRTVTEARIIAFTVERPLPRSFVSFRERGGPVEIPLATAYGRMGLSLHQICDSVLVGRRRHLLRIVEYRYALTPAGASEPLFRWEYVRDYPDERARWCRHHLQGEVPIPFGEGLTVSLKDLHLPTGFVTIEEILRFCIVDLKVKHLSDDWHERLEASYETFKVAFAPQGEARAPSRRAQPSEVSSQKAQKQPRRTR